VIAVNAAFWQAELAQLKGQLIDNKQGLSLSYPQLDQAIKAFINRLNTEYIDTEHLIPDNPKIAGKGKRQFVALVATNSLSFVIAYLALLREKHVILLLDAEDSTTNHQLIIKQYQANLLIIEDQITLTSKTPLWKNTLKLHSALALLISTSGSTGSKKFVKLTYNNLTSNTRSICQYLPITVDDTAVTTLPLHYSFGLSLLQTHLAVGATIVLTNASPLQKEFWQVFKQYPISSFYGVPYSYSLLNKLNFKRLPLSNLRYFAVAGGKILAPEYQALIDHCDLYDQQLFLMYGQTEATARIAFLSPEKVTSKSDFIGAAVPQGSLRLVDHQGQIITQANQPGELCYQGDNVFGGYAQSSNDLIEIEKIEWLSTGDIAVFDHQGDYKLVGRSKRIIKIVGKRINLDEVSQHLTAFFSQEFIVTGVDDQLIICFIEKNSGTVNAKENIMLNEAPNKVLNKSSNDTLKVKIQKEAAAFIRLHSKYITIKSFLTFPRLTNGKINFSALI